MGEFMGTYGPYGFGIVGLIIILAAIAKFWMVIVQPNLDNNNVRQEMQTRQLEQMHLITNNMKDITTEQTKLTDHQKEMLEQMGKIIKECRHEV